MKETDFQAKVILFSRPSQGGKDLITIQVRYPRFIHAELMTHRVLSRNARSSRAVPVNKLLQEEIYVPYFMKNKSGMQAFEKFEIDELYEIQQEWIRFAKETQRFSKWMADKGVHKQWANRPLEWFGYIDVLITSTEWENFFALRIHKDAMPEIRELAKTMDAAIKATIEKEAYQILEPGQWHVPYILEDEGSLALMTCLQLSVARSARLSYEPFDGNASLEKEISRYNLLLNSDPAHASPFEHQAQCCDGEYIIGENENEILYFLRSNLDYPWSQYRKFIEQKIEIKNK